MAPSFLHNDIAKPHTQEADFFTMTSCLRSAILDHAQTPHQNIAQDISVAARFGPRPSGAASEILKSNTFGIYPSEESNVTKSLVLGYFRCAVTLCLSAKWYTDAIPLAAKGYGR